MAQLATCMSLLDEHVDRRQTVRRVDLATVTVGDCDCPESISFSSTCPLGQHVHSAGHQPVAQTMTPITAGGPVSTDQTTRHRTITTVSTGDDS